MRSLHARRSPGPIGRRFLVLFGIVLIAAAASEARAGTVDEIHDVQSEALIALATGHFDQLNDMAERLGASRERLSDGRWKLPFVVSGLTLGLPPRDDTAWEARRRSIETWLARAPDSPTPYVAKAQFLIASAWDARGSGYAHTVKPDDWPVFQERMAQARNVLESSASISKKSPLWFESMLTIATAQAWQEEELLQLFRDGVAAEPTDYFLYFETANYLLPRWHGSAAKLATFVNEAVQASQQREGQTLYARIYWSVSSSLPEEAFTSGQVDWPRMRAGFEDIVRLYPDNWNLNAFAYFACKAEDWKTARDMGRKLHSVESQIWVGTQSFQACMNHAVPQEDQKSGLTAFASPDVGTQS